MLVSSPLGWIFSLGPWLHWYRSHHTQSQSPSHTLVSPDSRSTWQQKPHLTAYVCAVSCTLYAAWGNACLIQWNESCFFYVLGVSFHSISMVIAFFSYCIWTNTIILNVQQLLASESILILLTGLCSMFGSWVGEWQEWRLRTAMWGFVGRQTFPKNELSEEFRLTLLWLA